MVLKLYIDYLSPPCRAIVIFLQKNNIPHEVHTVSIPQGETRKPEFTQINPMQKVPCIVEDDGYLLTESAAILKYLITKPNISKKWYPTFPKQRAKVDEYIAWQHSSLRKSVGTVFAEQVVKPLLMGTPIDESAVLEGKKTLDELLDKVETYFFGNKDWIAGSEMTIADVLAVCDLMQVVAIGYNVAAGHPRLAKWMSCAKQQLGPLFDEAHKPVLEFGEKFKIKRAAKTNAVKASKGVKQPAQ